jgi:hypothetical protein
MEDAQLTQSNSPVAAKTSDGLRLPVQTCGQVGNDEILFIRGFGQIVRPKTEKASPSNEKKREQNLPALLPAACIAHCDYQ